MSRLLVDMSSTLQLNILGEVLCCCMHVKKVAVWVLFAAAMEAAARLPFFVYFLLMT